MKIVSIADQASAASCDIHILRVYNICSYTVQECTVYIFVHQLSISFTHNRSR